MKQAPEAVPSDKRVRLAVIVANSAHWVHANGEVERTVKLFDMPPEVADYIRRVKRETYASVSLAVEEVGDD